MPPLRPDLSIVIPTCDRAPLLERCLAAIYASTHCAYEAIVVDGASADGTSAVLDRARRLMGDRLRVIREPAREGFVRAVNKGFRAAEGRRLMWLNDDARPRPGTIDLALAQLTGSKADVGLLAFFHAWQGTRSVAYEARRDGKVYRLLHVRGTLYANFGIGQRETFAALGYFDERFFFNAADPDFSLKVWHAGLKVEPAYATAIDHDEHADDRRSEDTGRGGKDNEALFAKWDLPEKNAARNDFDPKRPCTLKGRRGGPATKAG